MPLTPSSEHRLRSWIVVTGASGGIGRAIVERSVADGYSVFATSGGDASFDAPDVRSLALDLAEPRFADQLKRALEDEGVGSGSAALHGVVNCAGVSRGDDIERITDDDWLRSMEVNATAPMRLVRALLPLFSTAGGAIVNVASPVGILGARKVSYAASKAALLGLNAAMARNLGSRGIRVNALLPGPTITKMTADWSEAKRAEVASGTLLGRLCKPRDVAGVVAFLLGPDSSFVTGATLNVTGGANVGIGG